jgi:hypothetical protein
VCYVLSSGVSHPSGESGRVERAFAADFSHFLRHAEDVWRLRRRDSFQPLDANLVEHRISLECRIDAELVRSFLDAVPEPSYTTPKKQTVKDGDELTLYVPAIRQSKRLLLEFSAVDAAGAAISVLSRYEGSRVAAAYILYRLGGEVVQEPSDDDRIALSTLMFQNAQDTARRIGAWGRPFPKQAALRDADLPAWIEREGNGFRAEVGTKVCANAEMLELLRARSAVSKWQRVPRRLRIEDGLSHFVNLREVGLHSLRDLLKMVADFEPALPQSGRSLDEAPRALLMRDPDALATRAVAALAALERLGAWLEAAANGGNQEGERALHFGLSGWMAYAVVPVRLGMPVRLEFSQTLPLPIREDFPPLFRGVEKRISSFWRTSQELPIGTVVKDANVVHVEVALPGQELHLRLRAALWRLAVRALLRRRPLSALAKAWPPLSQRIRKAAAAAFARLPRALRSSLDAVFASVTESIVGRLVRWGLRNRLPRDHVLLAARVPGFPKPWVGPLERFFGATESPSPRLLHVYSSRQLAEASDEDLLTPSLVIVVPLRLRFSIFLAYLISSVAFVAAGSWVAWAFVHATIDGKEPAALEPLVTVAALAATLGLWLTSIQHSRPIMTAKLFPARACFFLALVALVGTPIAFAVGQAIRALQ